MNLNLDAATAGILAKPRSRGDEPVHDIPKMWEEGKTPLTRG